MINNAPTRSRTQYPDIRAPTQPWNLNLVLMALTQKQFEPLANCSLLHLSMKVTFLIAITSARHVGEIGAFVADPPYMTFFKDEVTLQTHPKFLPKVRASFHVNQPIQLSFLNHTRTRLKLRCTPLTLEEH